jgi:alkyl sulfatase BDS1-like metallo-beta-lactamase superfamily hydrolase
MGMFFDFLAMRVNAEKAAGLQLRIDWVMSGEPERWKLTLSHSALSHAVGSHGAEAMATVRLNRATLGEIVGGGGFAAAMQQGKIPIDGDVRALRQLLGTLDTFNPMFNILEP